MNNQDLNKENKENKENLENTENQEHCNQCYRECPKERLLCGRGKAHFGIADDQEDRRQTSETFRERRARNRREYENRNRGRGDWHGQPEGEMSLSQLLCRCGHIAGMSDSRFRGQGRILHILSRQQEMSQKELQEAMQVEAGSLSEIMGKMEAKGMLERKKDENDRRRMLVQLTEAGQRAALESMQETSTGEEMFRVLSDEEQQQLRELLEKLLSQWKNDFEKYGHGRQRGRRHGGDHHHQER